MNPTFAFACAECGQPLYVGQPMQTRGRDDQAHVGCAVMADLQSQYGAEELQRYDTLPSLTHPKAA
jgi:hypothetical protein